MIGTDFMVLLPLLIIAGGSLLEMVIIALGRNHRMIWVLTLLALGASFLSLIIVSPRSPHQISSLLIVDEFALFYIGLILAASFAITLLSYNYLKAQEGNLEEYYLLLLLATLGSSLLVASRHFISLFLGLEILSVSLYVLITYQVKREKSIEAGIKYLILAAASSAFLLFGMALVYAALGAMEISALAGRLSTIGENHLLVLSGFALMTVGLGFKLAVVPFHMWTPDVYEGAPAPVSAFIASISKGGMFAVLLRFFIEIDIHRYESFQLIFSFIAIASMFGGNLLALLQQNLKRILAYSSIAHLGYLLVAFLAGKNQAVEAATFYLATYFIMTIGAFGVIAVLSTKEKEAERLEDYQGLFWQAPWLATIFTVIILSLAGIPLTAGFIGKFYLLSAGIDSDLWLLAVMLVVNSAIGLFYYLRIIVAMYSTVPPDEEAEGSFNHSISLEGGFVLAMLALMIVWFGIFPEQLIEFISEVAVAFQHSMASSNSALP